MKIKWVKRGVLALLLVISIFFGAVEIVKRKFDPEFYRADIIEYVKKEYGVTLDFESIKYTLVPYLGVIAENVKAVHEDSFFTARKISLSPSIAALFTGKLAVKRLEILNPVTLLHRYADGKWNFERIASGGKKAEGKTLFLPKRIDVIEGDVSFIDELVSEKPASFHLSSVNLNFVGDSLLRPASFSFTADLKEEGRKANLKLNFSSSINLSISNWGNVPVKGSAVVVGVRPARFAPYIEDIFPPKYMERHFSMEMDFSGKLSEKINFNGGVFIRPEYFDDKPEIRAARHPDDRHFEVRGTLDSKNLKFDRITIFLPEITLSGEMEIEDYRGGDPVIGFRLDTSLIEVSSLSRFVPPEYRAEPMVKFMVENIKSGGFQLSDINFKGSYTSFLRLGEPENLGLVFGKMELKDVSLKLKEFEHPVEKINGTLLLDNEKLSFYKVSAQYRSSRLKDVVGTIEDFRTRPMLRATINADINVKEFHEGLLRNIGSERLSEVFSPVKNLEGKIGVDFNIEVDLQEPRVLGFDGDFLLEEVGFSHDLFDLPVKGLHGRVKINPSDISIENVTWQTGSSRFDVLGVIERYASPDYEINFTINAEGEPVEFAKTRIYSARYIKHVKGLIKSKLQVEGNLEDLKFRHTADITSAEYHIEGLLSKKAGVPLSIETRGSFKKNNRLTLDSALVNAGSSQFLVTGKMPDIASMDEFELDVKIKRLDLADLPGFFPTFYEGGSKGKIEGQLHVLKSKKKLLYNYGVKADVEKLDLKQIRGIKWRYQWIDPEGIAKGRFKVSGKTGRPFAMKGKIETKDAGFRTRMYKPFYGVSGTVVLKDDSIVFKNIPVRMGDSSATVSGKAVLTANPEIHVNALADAIYLDDIFALGKAKKIKQGEKKYKHKYFPRYFVNIKSKKGTLDRITYNDAEVVFTYYKRNYKFDKFDFVSNGGKWKSVGVINTEGGNQLWVADASVKDLDIDTFSQQMWPGSNKLSGRLDAKGRFTGNGIGWERLKKTLGGNVGFTARKGRLKEYQAISDIFSVVNIIPMFQKRTEGQKGIGLPYKTVEGKMKITDGVGHTEDMRLEGNVVRMSVVGDFRFTDDTVDLKVGVKPFTMVDKIITNIPIAGRILGGKEKSLIVSYYDVKGDMYNPKTKAVPAKSIGRNIFGIFKRILELPGLVLEESNTPEKKEKSSGKIRSADERVEIDAGI